MPFVSLLLNNLLSINVIMRLNTTPKKNLSINRQLYYIEGNIYHLSLQLQYKFTIQSNCGVKNNNLLGKIRMFLNKRCI